MFCGKFENHKKTKHIWKRTTCKYLHKINTEVQTSETERGQWYS